MSQLTVGTIAEKVTDAGVTIDSLNIKDGTLALAKSLKGNTQTDTFANCNPLDLSTYNNFIITLASGSQSLTNPSTDVTATIGTTGVIIFIQPSSSSAGTVSLGTDFETVGGATLELSSSNNAYDIVPFFIKGANSVLLGTPQLAFS